MLLPKSYANTLQSRDIAAADAMAASSKTAMSSDEFLSFKDIDDQIGALKEYCAKQREAHESYSIPRPCGWKLLVLVLQPPTKTQGGLHVPNDVTEAYAHKSVQGIVLGLGHSAFTDKDRFPEGPWCKLGNRIIFKRYDAQIFELANGMKLGIMNDTQPIGTIGGLQHDIGGVY